MPDSISEPDPSAVLHAINDNLELLSQSSQGILEIQAKTLSAVESLLAEIQNQHVKLAELLESVATEMIMVRKMNAETFSAVSGLVNKLAETVSSLLAYTSSSSPIRGSGGKIQ
jgi:archaellum component FlaC